MKYNVIGMMSGTSMDGMDLCHCSFEFSDNRWNYTIQKAFTIEYPDDWLMKLGHAHLLPSQELLILHFEYGSWIGKQIKAHFGNIPLDFISSHGHTVFHQADKGLTFQLGHGQSIANESGFTTVCDFRTQDVLLGGNGAPLVPIGDRMLFSNFQGCINLGGFANLSFLSNNKTYAYDICAVNIVLNHLSNKLGKKYDANGDLARKGNLNPHFLNQLNQLPYYIQSFPKSLGREWAEHNILPLIEENTSIEELLRTYTEHAAIQISEALKNLEAGQKVLFTGGGCNNKFLIERIKAMTTSKIEIPDQSLVDFKEALVFAFLAVLKIEGKINVMSSVTGSKRDSKSGVIFKPE